MIRPFQVNPHYQWLNDPGGVGKISSLYETDGKIYVNEDKVLIPLEKYDSFGAISFDEGNLVKLIKENITLKNKSVIDDNKLASGVLEYSFNLKSGEEKNIYLAVPFYGEASVKENLTKEIVE